MTDYQFAQGKNNAAGLATLSPQPRMTTDVDYTLQTDGLGIAQPVGGGFATWLYVGLTYAQLDSLLTTFGLSRTTRSANCTVRLRDAEGSTYANYNGVITLQPLERGTRYWSNVTFELRRLVAL